MAFMVFSRANFIFTLLHVAHAITFKNSLVLLTRIISLLFVILRATNGISLKNNPFLSFCFRFVMFSLRFELIRTYYEDEINFSRVFSLYKMIRDERLDWWLLHPIDISLMHIRATFEELSYILALWNTISLFPVSYWHQEILTLCSEWDSPTGPLTLLHLYRQSNRLTLPPLDS